jgi:hypothetical protein
VVWDENPAPRLKRQAVMERKDARHIRKREKFSPTRQQLLSHKVDCPLLALGNVDALLDEGKSLGSRWHWW